jgi:hypothetical protein
MAGPAAAETERITRTIALDEGGTLRLSNFSGRVTITGTTGRDVTIVAVRQGDRDDLDRVTLDIRQNGSTVVVDANQRDRSWLDWFTEHNHAVETDLDVKVPRRTHLRLNVFQSPVTVTDVEGSHDVRTFSARLRLDTVKGRIRVHSFSGEVEISADQWRADDDIDVETFSGDITLRLPESAGGTVRFDSFSGDLSSDIPLTFLSSRRRRLTAEFGRGGGELTLKTFSGDARIEK